MTERELMEAKWQHGGCVYPWHHARWMVVDGKLLGHPGKKYPRLGGTMLGRLARYPRGFWAAYQMMWQYRSRPPAVVP